MIKDDHHILASLNLCTAVIEMLRIQPQVDYIIELLKLMETQIYILENLVEDRHCGSDYLDDVITKCDIIFQQIKQLNEA